MTSASNLHLTNLRLPSGELVHLSIENGLISAITPAAQASSPPAHAQSIDAAGRLLFPGFVDAHAHMDKSLLGLPWYRNEVGPSLTDKIDNERRYRVEQGIDSYAQSSHVARRMINAGTTHVRTFVDIDTEIGLSGFDGVMRMRDEMRDELTVQVVAFPQSGMLARPGTVTLMEAALRNGAHVVGGLDPSTIDRDPKGHLDTIFDMAARYNVDVDVHLHEPAELGALSVELIAERTAALGWQGRVVISHAFCLGGVDDSYTGKLIELLLKNDIAIMSHGPSGSRAAPPVKRLHQAGVRLCAGNDGIRDTWGPLNMPDMLLRAFLIAYRNNFRRDDELEIALHMCSYGGANIMGAQNYGLAVGSRADLVIVDGQNHLEAMIERPPRWLVLKGGKIVQSAK